MVRLVMKLQSTLGKPINNQEGGMKKFTTELGRFCQNMEVLFLAQDTPTLSGTPTPTPPTLNSSGPFPPPLPCFSAFPLSGVSPFRNTLFCSTLDEMQIHFLSHAITSHLQTHGSTVVTGSNAELVNMYV